MAESFVAAAAAMRAVHDKSLNLEHFREFIETAASNEARLLILPEASLQGFLFQLDGCYDPDEVTYHWENAESIPGPSTEVVASWAAEHQMTIVFGLLERVDHPAAPVLHNSSALIGPDGLIGVYRKVHQPSEEALTYRPARDWPVFPTPLGKVGMMICYDQCFPEAARELTLRGADLLLIPNAWPKSDPASDDRYDFFGRARAAENCRWTIQSNQVGPSDKGEFTYLGCSRIIDPTGTVVAQTGDGEQGLALAEISPTKFDPARARSGWYLQQRVPSSYKTIGDDSTY